MEKGSEQIPKPLGKVGQLPDLLQTLYHIPLQRPDLAHKLSKVLSRSRGSISTLQPPRMQRVELAQHPRDGRSDLAGVSDASAGGGGGVGTEGEVRPEVGDEEESDESCETEDGVEGEEGEEAVVIGRRGRGGLGGGGGCRGDNDGLGGGGLGTSDHVVC